MNQTPVALWRQRGSRVWNFNRVKNLLIARLAQRAFRFILPLMFELTRREQTLVVGIVFILVLGLGVRYWRGHLPVNAMPAVEVPKTQ